MVDLSKGVIDVEGGCCMSRGVCSVSGRGIQINVDRGTEGFFCESLSVLTLNDV